MVFFDDHIRRDYSHIVDVRDHVTGQPIAFKESKGVYLCRVRPVDIILDPQYFIGALHECEVALEAIEGSAVEKV